MDVTLQFSELMALPVDGAGLTITDDNGGVFTVSSVSFGPGNDYLVYAGTWAPDDPVEGVDAVSVSYLKSVGNLIGESGMEVENFSVDAQYLGAIPLGVIDWSIGDPMQWHGVEYVEWA